MQRLLYCLTVVLILASGCDQKSSAPARLLPPLEAATVTPEALWKRISQEAPFSRYSFWPGYEGMHEGSVPHGPFHKLYINDVLLRALPVTNGQAPYGTLVVKDNYNRDQEPSAVYVMAKIRGFDPEHNDWYWARFNPDGSEAVGGKLSGCIECHLGAQKNDFIFLQPLDPQKDE